MSLTGYFHPVGLPCPAKSEVSTNIRCSDDDGYEYGRGGALYILSIQDTIKNYCLLKRAEQKDAPEDPNIIRAGQ